jgi:hypothetical protein
MTMKQTKKQAYSVVRYWHPRKGGWYHALLLKKGRKWALVEDMGTKRLHHRVLVKNVQPSDIISLFEQGR